MTQTATEEIRDLRAVMQGPVITPGDPGFDHGRRVCIARKPRCEDCVLNDFCPSAQVPTRPRSQARA